MDPFSDDETYPFDDTDPSEETDSPGDPDTRQDSQTSSGPAPDFKTLQSAAATYRMFGAEPVPLFNDTVGENGSASQRDFFRTPRWRCDPGSSRPEDGPRWEEADGIGLVSGKNGWQGLSVEPIILKSVLHNLRRRSDTGWIARNDTSALIYFRTDADEDVLRALAAIFQASMRPQFKTATDVGSFGGPDGPAVLPVPPSKNLVGGQWEFLEDEPQAPPPYRGFQVGTEVLTKGSGDEDLGESRATPNLGIKRNYEGQTYQSRRKSSLTYPAR